MREWNHDANEGALLGNRRHAAARHRRRRRRRGVTGGCVRGDGMRQSLSDHSVWCAELREPSRRGAACHRLKPRYVGWRGMSDQLKCDGWGGVGTKRGRCMPMEQITIKSTNQIRHMYQQTYQRCQEKWLIRLMIPVHTLRVLTLCRMGQLPSCLYVKCDLKSSSQGKLTDSQQLHPSRLLSSPSSAAPFWCLCLSSPQRAEQLAVKMNTCWKMDEQSSRKTQFPPND